MTAFNPLTFFEMLPQIAMAGLALIIALVVWTVWRTLAPAAPGIPLGNYEIIGRYAGGRLKKSIQGMLIECTPLFMNEEMEPIFKELLLQDIDISLKREPNAELQSAREQFEKYPLSKSCHIIATREKLFRKHVIVQWGYVDKPLNAYASHDPEPKFSLIAGLTAKGTVYGRIRMLPDYELYKLGKVKVSLFKPDPLEEGDETEEENKLPECLAKTVLYASATVELKELVKSKDEQNRNLRKENAKMAAENSAMSSEMDTMRTAMSKFSTTGKLPKSFAYQKFDLMDFVALSVPTLVGFYVADYSKFQPVVGVIFGLFVGAFLLYKRRE